MLRFRTSSATQRINFVYEYGARSIESSLDIYKKIVALHNFLAKGNYFHSVYSLPFQTEFEPIFLILLYTWK